MINRFLIFLLSFLCLSGLLIIKLKNIPAIAYAQEDSFKIYDCSQTGKCIEGSGETQALYAGNLAPGLEVTESWQLQNNSQKSCRVYLRLRSLDEETVLPERISLSAIGKTEKNETKVLSSTVFSKLLEKQSIYLSRIPASSRAEIIWKILLDKDVDDQYQGLRKNFSTVLYSYCLGDDNQITNGQVAGAQTDKDKQQLKKYSYLSLSFISIAILIWLKKKK